MPNLDELSNEGLQMVAVDSDVRKEYGITKDHVKGELNRIDAFLANHKAEMLAAFEKQYAADHGTDLDFWETRKAILKSL